MTNPLPDWYLRQLEERDPTPARYAVETWRVIADEQVSLWEVGRALKREAERSIPRTGGNVIFVDPDEPDPTALSRRELREANRKDREIAASVRAAVTTTTAGVQRNPAGPPEPPPPFRLRLELAWLRIRLRWRLRGVGDGFHLHVHVPTA